MMKKHSQCNILVWTTFVALGLALSGGCVPVDSAELGTFMRDLLLNAVSAFLL